MRVPMRQLPAPFLNYRNGDTVGPVHNDGQWNLSGRIFSAMGDLRSIHFVGTARSITTFGLGANGSPLFNHLTGYLRGVPPPDLGRRNYTINAAPLIATLLGPGLARQALPSKQQMVVWTHPNGNKDEYTNFRTPLDRELGYPSLCIIHAKLWNNRNALAGFAANSAMKMNVRVGGSAVASPTASISKILYQSFRDQKVRSRSDH